MGYLTTHILDTANGCPAAGVRITIKRLDGESAQTLKQATTNADGRCDEPLLEGADFTAGRYELAFAMGDYFASKQAMLDSPPFVEDVILRFGVAHADEHYHVPLLASPYSYSTYRGS
ncbi:MAG TPA: hydroxyisourate hydrolase [Salinisphaeraceae bacterium]|nr:hydroxyisourate hydrolase [Salinisphaeraceae bacterium]